MISLKDSLQGVNILYKPPIYHLKQQIMTERRKKERKERGERRGQVVGCPTRKEGEFIVGDMEEYKT